MNEKKNYNRYLALILALAIVSAFVSCAGNGDGESAEKTAASVEVNDEERETSSEQEKEEEASISEEEPISEAEPEEPSEEESSQTEAVEETGGNESAAGVSEINILEADGSNTELYSGDAVVTIGNKQISLSGAYIIDGVDAEVTGGVYESVSSDQNVFLVINGGSLKLRGAQLIKTGDAAQNDSKRTSDVSDDYNFYGMNSVVLVVGEDSSAELTDCIITSDCSGANAVFSTAGAEVSVRNVKITTTGNSSRGVYATYGGTINADHVDITTSGAHCAPIATDRGGGYVTVTNSTVQCSGDGSPCIYSTGEIVVENVIGTSGGAQAAVIEGRNSITMTGCSFTVTGGNNGVMLYQSMSGDAADKDATASFSTLTMTDTVIDNGTEGAMFYITNTTSVIELCGGNTLTSASCQLINAAAGRWGSDGSNGGHVSLNITGDTLTDSASTDEISSCAINILDGAEFTGSTSGNVSV